MAGGVVGNITTSGTGAGTHLIASTFYATCETAAATVAKVAKLTNTNTSTVTLITGMTITVKFTYSNTAASPTLTIQSSGGTQLVAATALKRVGTTAIGATESTSWKAGAAVIFVYDGTNWVEVSSSTDAVPASGGTFTGPVTFDDSVAADEITTGNLVATGSGSFVNNVSAATFNGYTLSAAAGKAVDNSITAASTSQNLPTASAVAAFVEGKGYTNNTGTVTSVGVTNGGGLTVSGSPVTTSGSITIGHSNSVTAKTAAAQSAKTLTFGGTFNIYEEKYDAQGHITGVASYAMTMPANPNTDYKQRVTLATTSKAYITGVTTAPTASNQDLQAVGDTGVYLTTTAGQINATTYKVNEAVTLQYNSTTQALDFVFN